MERTMASEKGTIEVEVIRARLPKMLEKIDPEEISDDLFSLRIIDKDLYESLFDRSETRKEKTRKLIFAVFGAIQNDPFVFGNFCTVLEKSKKPSVREIGSLLKGDLEDQMKQRKCSSENNQDHLNFDVLKENLEMLRIRMLQSDKNIEAKHSIIKEFISDFIQHELEKGNDKDAILSLLKSICYVDMLVPVRIHNWCFEEFQRIVSEQAMSARDSPPLLPLCTERPRPLFCKENVYHALLLAHVCSQDEEKLQSFFTKNHHMFEEISVSKDPSVSHDETKIEKYVIARKDNVLFVGFQGECDLDVWLDKASSFNEGISVQKERIPIWFFVEYLRKEEGRQIIFAGFSFGGLLAMAVHADLWRQSCLRIDDLRANVACICFGAPLVNLNEFERQSVDFSCMKENNHLFYVEDDLYPCLLQCVDFAKQKDKLSSHQQSKLYAGTIGGDIVAALSELQKVNVKIEKTTEGPKKCMDSLKVAMKAGVPSIAYQLPDFGIIHYICNNRDTFVLSDLTDQAFNDHMQYPTLAIIDSLQTDFIKKHSIDRYDDLLRQCFLNPDSYGGKYIYPLNFAYPKNFVTLKPEVLKAKFSRHADEVAIVLEGQNLWFCHKLKVGNRGAARLIDIETKHQVTTMRSINFNYTPQHCDDLLIDQMSTTVDITLYSHFCKPIKCTVEVEKMVDYEISFRQRQLAKLTPSDVITLSLLIVMLERPSAKFLASGRQSKQYNSIRQFLEYVTQIVPVESICHAIANESDENAWKCANALIDSHLEPSPSILFLDSLCQANLRLTTGIRPALLYRVQEIVLQRIMDAYHPSIIQLSSNVLANEIVLTEEKGVLRPILKKTKKRCQKNVFDKSHQPEPPLYSDMAKGGASQSISIPNRKIEQPVTCSENSQSRIILEIRKMIDHIANHHSSKTKVICGHNIGQLYSSKARVSSGSLKPPIDFLKVARKKLSDLQAKAGKELSTTLNESEDSVNQLTAMHNEEMIRTVNVVMSQEVAICLSLLGAFMEHQIKVPFVNSPEKTAHVLQTTHSSSAVGVWSLFSLNMINLQSLLHSRHGKLIIEVQEYIAAILGQNENPSQKIPSEKSMRDYSHDRGKYAGKLQFLLQGMIPTVSCNTKYISYSLERQLSELCNTFDIRPSTKVEDLVQKWNKKFSKSILFHVEASYRPLLARWLIWSLNIHKLREDLASCTTIGVVGLSKSGKSYLVKSLFNQNTISGTASMQRTTVPFLYNLEGIVDGLNIVDFPGVDDKDKAVVQIANILLRLAQIVVLVMDYRRVNTDSAKKWLHQMDESGVPVLLCLTHADKFYANECLKKHGKDCSKEIAKKLILQELETLKEQLGTSPNRETIFCSFCVDGDSVLDSEEGRSKLTKIGIQSQQFVGEWLVERLGHLKQNAIAEKLEKYFKSFTRSEELKQIIPCAVRSVTVCAEVTTEIEGCKTKVVVWPKYGLKLTIPSDALSDGVTYTLAIKTITSQEFDIPLDSEVVSAFYWIYSSHRFIKPVTLELQHCARIDNEEVASCMSFIVARCNQEKLPYQFKKKEGVFIPHKTTGNISVISFSIFAIIKMVALSCGMTMNMLEEPVAAHIHQHKPTRYSYQYKVFGRKCNPKVYQFDFLFYKDLPPFISAIDLKYGDNGWKEAIPTTSIEFERPNSSIEIMLSKPPVPEWNTVCMSSNRINQISVNHCDESTAQQSCRIEFRWNGKGEPTLIDYLVTLIGALGTPVIKLKVPLTEVIDVSHVPSMLNVTEFPSTSGYECMLDKNPELEDVYKLLKGDSSSWDDIGRELSVPRNFRQGLSKNVTFSENGKLEEVLAKWLECNSSKSPATFGTLIEALKSLKKNKLVENIQDYLSSNEAQIEYNSH